MKNDECSCEQKYLIEVDTGLFKCENCGKIHGEYLDVSEDFNQINKSCSSLKLKNIRG